ncbi:hypothetical protein AYI68_g8162 [Smittium mucronatum]|uniref:RanBD1 domain-containing protein n=1 Tax=Smittium mucronatum TaxID=133383 RepID=A0A1R0GLP4_9FUNG|nr:hypothetical protein AYI68_g8162 [Smittium mucronatum]
MSKRVAETQITQDNPIELDVGDSSKSDQSGAFKVADESVLKNRMIKVPKSRLKGDSKISTPSKDDSDNKPSVFKNFAFGQNNSGNSSLFPSSNSTTSNQPAPSLFGGSNSMNSFSSTQTETSDTTVSDNASNSIFGNQNNPPKAGIFGSSFPSSNAFKNSFPSKPEGSVSFNFNSTNNNSSEKSQDNPVSNSSSTNGFVFGSANSAAAPTATSKSFVKDLPTMPSYSFGNFATKSTTDSNNSSSLFKAPLNSNTESNIPPSGTEFKSLVGKPIENNLFSKKFDSDPKNSSTQIPSNQTALNPLNNFGSISANKQISSDNTSSFKLFNKDNSRPDKLQTDSETQNQKNNSTIPKTERIKDYLKSLRGLNSSFVKTLSECYESDPFEDFKPLFPQYIDFINSLNSNYSDILKETSENDSTSNSASNAISNSSSIPPKTSLFSQSISNTSQFSSDSQSKEKTSDFHTETSSSSFGITTRSRASIGGNSSTNNSQIEKPQASLFATSKTSDDKPPASLFGKNESSSSIFSGVGTKSDLFSQKNSDSIDVSTVPGNGFKDSLNKSEKPIVQIFSKDSTKDDNPQAPKLATFVVGDKVVTSGIMSPNTSGEKSKEIAKAFSFSSNPTPTTSIFGNNTGSSLFGNSTGSSLFGNKQSTTSQPNPSSIFGSVQTEQKTATNDQDEEEVAPSSPSKLAQSAGSKGVGEEDETTVYDVRAKIFKHDPNHEQGPKYVDLGVGFLRLNTREQDGKKHARVLCRQDGTSIVTLNSSLTKNTPLHHKEGTKDILLISFESASSTSKYIIRVKTPALSNDLFLKIKSTIDTL